MTTSMALKKSKAAESLELFEIKLNRFKTSSHVIDFHEKVL